MPKKTVESLVIELSADVASLKKDMASANRTVKRGTDGMARSARNAAKSIAAIGAGFAVGATIRKIISATKAQEQAIAQLEQGLATTGGVVGQSIDELTKKAVELQKVTTFGDEEFIEAQAQLLSFTSIVGAEFDKTLELAADLSTRFGTDLKSSVLQLGKALNDPVANLSALSRSGIQFNKTQKDMIKSLVESGRLMDAQNIILKELETQFGGSARAARDTFGGAIEGLSNAFDDLFESTEGLDDAKDSVEGLTAALQDPKTIRAINGITSGLITATTKYIEFVTTAGTFLPDFIQETAKDLIDELNGTFDGSAEDVKKLNDEITRLERLLSLPGGGDKEGIAAQLEQLRKERELFQAFPAEEAQTLKLNVEVETDEQQIDLEAIQAAALAQKAADKAAKALAKEQATQLKGVQSDLSSLRTPMQKYLDSVATATSLEQAGKISREDLANVTKLYSDRLADATGANKQWKDDIEDSKYFARQATTEIEALEKELEKLYSLAEREPNLISPETVKRNAERINKEIEEIKEAGKEINEVGEAIAEGMQDVVADGFVSIWKGGFDEVLANFGDLLINLAAEAAAADFLNAIGFGGKDNKGGNLGNLFDGLFSFDGGGYTGSGNRTGGLDGRGGFLAMVHPNETVVDHTKGQGVGSINNNITFVASSNEKANTKALGQLQRQLKQANDAGARFT